LENISEASSSASIPYSCCQLYLLASLPGGWTEWYGFHGHHIAGRRFDKHVEYFCQRCHSGFSEEQKSFPKPTSEKPGRTECAGNYCLGLSTIFKPVARMLEDFGHTLIQLDGERPDQSEQSLTQKIGYFLIALAAILERIAEKLEQHGYALVEEAQMPTASV